MRNHNARINKIENKSGETEKELDDHKLDSERRFAKDVNMQESLKRIHERLDRLPMELKNLFTQQNNRNDR